MRRFMPQSDCVSRAGSLAAVACAFAAILTTGCSRGNQEVPPVSLVHATDPLIFLASAQDPSTKDTGEKQQALDEKALGDLFQYVRSLSSTDGGRAEAPTFLVLTGNFGLSPCPIAQSQLPAAKQPAAPKAAKNAPPAKTGSTPPALTCTDVNPDRRKSQIQRLARALGSSPFQDLYLAAGSADVAHEDPGGLQYFNQLIDDVQSALAAAKSDVRLHNLMRCYAADGAAAASCYADIAGSPYCLIGLPSFSFRNEGASANKDSREAEQFEIFRGLLQQARQAGRRALIVTGIPEIDDPFLLAQDRYAGKAPPKANDPPKASDQDQKTPRSPWSTWNVSRKMLDGWRDVLASDTVAGVLAGNLRDSHKEIYRRPYAWSSLNDQRLDFRKLFLAPPLSVAGQDASPIQARGFSWIRAWPDRVVPALYWYRAETGVFEPDAPPPSPRPQEAPSFYSPRILTTLWHIDSTDSALIRLAVLLIAFIAGFLTVVAIWQLPAVDNPLAGPKTDAQKDKAPGQAASAPDTSPFTSKLGKTVVAGLGGLVFAEITKTLGNQQPAPEMRWFYVVWFVIFFFLWLISLNLVRAITEALRAGVAIPQKPVLRFLYRLRVPLITFLDTFVNLIQGKNQTVTRAFSDMIIDQQRNDLQVAESIRCALNDFLNEIVARPHPHGGSHGGSVSIPAEDQRSRVRVNISVLSADQSQLFYVAKSPASPRRPFPKVSLAWVSAFTGEPLWYISDYRKDQDAFAKIVLYQNDPPLIEGRAGPLMLSEYYQDRRGEYQAFILFPLPWPPRREVNPAFVRGAVHISFDVPGDFERIWPVLDPDRQHDPAEWPYPAHKPVLSPAWCPDGEVRRTLSTHLVVLSELLSGFNEVIYKSYLEPTGTR
ncbi:MAG: hypothetical protein LAP87_20765 [Acidobacteriia bacterium]|nr:hypothetical protein [Terriglobia bacterium]